MYKLLRAKNGGLKEEVTRFARELVATPSLSGEEGKVADLVEAQMREIGYDEVARDEVGNIVGIIYGRGSESTVLLNAHMDTVSAGEVSSWPRGAHSGEVRDGYLCGLGASDCKGGLAAQVFVADLLKRSLLPLRGSLVVAATVSEEQGDSPGVRTLLKKTLPEMGVKPDYVVLGEPTDLGLYCGHDGWAEFDVCIEGTNPFQVEDASEAVLSDFRQAADDRLDETKMNCLPLSRLNGMHRTTIQLNRRLGASEEVARVAGQMKHQATLAAKSSGSVVVAVAVRRKTQRLYNGTTTVVRRIVKGWETDPFGVLVGRARDALIAADCKADVGKWQLGRLGMGTAGNVYLKEFGVPVVGYGPGNEDAAHAPNERVEIAKIHAAVYGTTAIVHSLIGVPVWGWTADEI